MLCKYLKIRFCAATANNEGCHQQQSDANRERAGQAAGCLTIGCVMIFCLPDMAAAGVERGDSSAGQLQRATNRRGFWLRGS